MNNEIETVELEIDDFEEIASNRACVYKIPVATIGREWIYFNVLAAKLVPNKFRWRVNDEWCVIVPALDSDKKAYKRTKCKYGGVMIALPTELQTSYPFMKGTHKLYKSGNRICFRKYEVLDPEVSSEKLRSGS